MKKVIDGKLYNTETSTLLAKWDNGRNPNDFFFAESSIYKTKAGACISIHRTCLTYYKMSLLDDDGILAWAEKTGYTEFVLEHFPHLVREG